MLRRINWAACLPAAAVVGALAVTAGVLAERARDDGGRATEATSPAAVGVTSFQFRDIVARADESPVLQVLTPEQCKLAASTVRNTGKTFRQFIAAHGKAMASEFDTAQAAAEAWINAGCPPDAERGGFMGANGTLQLKPYAKSSFSAGGDAQGGTYGVIAWR
jgi:hypothetical protein